MSNKFNSMKLIHIVQKKEKKMVTAQTPSEDFKFPASEAN
jgi:hypothetical protein